MILTIRGLKGEQNNVEIDNNASVLDLKAVIMSQLNHPAACQKLLYRGRILEDNKFLSDYSIKDTETIVIMVTKAPELSEFEKKLQILISMGADRSRAEEALKAANEDLEKAKRLLIQSADEGEYSDEESYENDESSANRGTFGFLLNSEVFQSIRLILRQNPSEFEPLMTELESTNPELFELIRNNTEEFLSLVGLRMERRPAIELSSQEESDIKDLCELGFTEDDVLEAYLACDKKKDVAASYLFENFPSRFG